MLVLAFSPSLVWHRCVRKLIRLGLCSALQKLYKMCAFSFSLIPRPSYVLLQCAQTSLNHWLERYMQTWLVGAAPCPDTLGSFIHTPLCTICGVRLLVVYGVELFMHLAFFHPKHQTTAGRADADAWPATLGTILAICIQAFQTIARTVCLSAPSHC